MKSSEEHTMRNVLLLAVASTILMSCGEFSYKRGGSAADIANAHKACRGVAESELSQCLEKQGWEVQKFDDQELFAVASVEDNRMQDKPRPSSSATKASDQTEAATATEVQKTNPEPENTDPMQRYKINSWWKLGASDKKMTSDMNECSTTLGEAHQPDMVNQTYTRLFVICMHDKGWQALKTIK
jgi:hypothetical protein